MWEWPCCASALSPGIHGQLWAHPGSSDIENRKCMKEWASFSPGSTLYAWKLLFLKGKRPKVPSINYSLLLHCLLRGLFLFLRYTASIWRTRLCIQSFPAEWVKIRHTISQSQNSVQELFELLADRGLLIYPWPSPSIAIELYSTLL